MILSEPDGLTLVPLATLVQPLALLCTFLVWRASVVFIIPISEVAGYLFYSHLPEARSLRKVWSLGIYSARTFLEGVLMPASSPPTFPVTSQSPLISGCPQLNQRKCADGG